MLDARCKNDISDEECNKCLKHKIILQCPENCPDYEDWRDDGVQKADRHDKKPSREAETGILQARKRGWYPRSRVDL